MVNRAGNFSKIPIIYDLFIFKNRLKVKLEIRKTIKCLSKVTDSGLTYTDLRQDFDQ